MSRKYSDGEQQDAVSRIFSGWSFVDASIRVGCAPSTVRRWYLAYLEQIGTLTKDQLNAMALTPKIEDRR